MGSSWPSGSASSFEGMPGVPAHRARRSSPACCSAAVWAGDRRGAEGVRRDQRGDLDDHAQLDRDLDGDLPVQPRRPAAERQPGAAGRPGLQRHRRGREAAGVLGRPAVCRACTSACSSRSRRCSCSGSSSTARRSASRCARSASTRTRRQPRASPCARNYIVVMAICGAFAGLAGTLDVLGWQFRIATNDIHGQQARVLRHRGRAARAQHRGRGVLQRAAVRRADHRHLGPQPGPDGLRARAGREPHVHDPGPRRPARSPPTCSWSTCGGCAGAAAPGGGDRMSHDRQAHRLGRDRPRRSWRSSSPCRRSWCARRCRSSIVALAGGRGRRRSRSAAARSGSAGARSSPAWSGSPAAYAATQSGESQPRGGRRLGRAAGLDAALRDAADVRRARRAVLRALRRHQHRARGHDADRRVLRRLGRGHHRLVAAGDRDRDRRRARSSPRCTRCSRSRSAPTRSSPAPR